MHQLAREGRLCALLLITSIPALAGPTQRPDEPDAAASPVYYSSLLQDYPFFRRAEMADWRAVNDTVRRLGGPMGHMTMPAESGEHPAEGQGGTP